MTEPEESVSLALREVLTIYLPGTSSVCGSLNIPRFHRRRGASFSCVDVAVETAPLVEAVRSFRQGVRMTMPVM
jgi:hypothetical protein